MLTAARPGGLRCQTYSGPSQVRLTSAGLTHAKPPPSGSSHGPSQCNKRPDPLRAVLSRAAGSRPALPGHRASKGSNSGKGSEVSGLPLWPFVRSQAAKPRAPAPPRPPPPSSRAPASPAEGKRRRGRPDGGGGAPSPPRGGSRPRGLAGARPLALTL